MRLTGEIRPDVGELLLEQESGAEGILARLGVDGIIVANEMGWVPQPEAEWELAVTTEEGRVFHRRNGDIGASAFGERQSTRGLTSNSRPRLFLES